MLPLKTAFFALFLLSPFLLPAQEGQLHFEVSDQSNGQLMPARLSVLKEGKPFELSCESKGHLASRSNTVYTATGKGSISLPAGAYECWFGRGMEYSVVVKHIQIKDGETQNLKVSLIKELNTDGLVSGDLHLHTFTNSGHGDANLTERVISCVAEGLEWAVATDHNYITDYQPYMQATGLEGQMATTIGNEVSTSVGHFNIFPLAKDAAVVDSKPKDANTLFPSFRQNASPSPVIQINHPRWVASDYFNIKGLDLYFGTIKHPEWSWDFDGFEVLNENYQLGWITAPDNLQSVKRDWFNLLNHNRRYTGLGNSDSHSVVSAIAGVPRNYIISSTDEPSQIDEQELARNIKTQKVSVACGILPLMLHNGSPVMGSTIAAHNKTVDLQLYIQAPSWVNCHRAELICNGVVLQEFKIKPSKQAVRLDTTISVSPRRDSWYLLVAYGNKPMFPMVGKLDRPVYPLGFTNPVWVDAQGDDQFTSTFEQTKTIVSRPNLRFRPLLELFRTQPELFPSLLYHLFEMEHPHAVLFAAACAKEANTEQRLMLFRELAKTDMEHAQVTMEGLLKYQLTPLEEMTLASYVNFPIRKSRVDQFKKRRLNPELDEQLDFLATEFSYFHSGAKQQKAFIGFSNDDQIPNDWQPIHTDRNGFWKTPDTDHRSFFLKTKWRMRKDTLLPFYLNSSAPLNVYINEQSERSLPPNTKALIENKMISLPLKKGSNELLLQFTNSKDVRLCFHPASKSMLLDPALKLEEVEHLALNAPVQYQIKYDYKYHGFDQALTDGFRATTNHSKNQLWQGWNGTNAVFVIDLGEMKTINEITAGLLVSQNSWIFYPSEIAFSVSSDGDNFQSVFSKKLDAMSEQSAIKVEDIGGKIAAVEARYIKVAATKIEAIPDWHKAKGEQAWIFIDEVIVR